MNQVSVFIVVLVAKYLDFIFKLTCFIYFFYPGREPCIATDMKQVLGILEMSMDLARKDDEMLQPDWSRKQHVFFFCTIVREIG